jgi:DNA-directed RNA polymerase specialized sigma24 family protein
MTLSDALVLMAPSDASLPADDRCRRDDATTVVYHVMVRLARRTLPADHRDLVVQDVLIRLSKSRPGRLRYTTNDGEAEAYLLKALRNRMIDIHRTTQRERARWKSSEADDDGWAPFAPVVHDTPESLVIADQTVALVTEATTCLFDKAIPAIASTLQNPGGFLTNVDDLRAIAEGELTIDEIVDREGGHGDAYVKVRNRVYQRHKRTRAYLLEVPPNRAGGLPRLAEWLRDAALSPELEQEVRRIATRIFAPRVDRADARTDVQEHAS